MADGKERAYQEKMLTGRDKANSEQEKTRRDGREEAGQAADRTDKFGTGREMDRKGRGTISKNWANVCTVLRQHERSSCPL